MPHSGHLARGHLKLATPAPPAEPAQHRVVLIARAVIVTLGILWLSIASVVAAGLALMPLLWRRAPLGVRLRPLRREARVIRLPARKRIAPP